MTTLPRPDIDKLSDADKARLLAELNAEVDAQLACLNAPGAHEKLDEIMRKPLRLNGRVKVGLTEDEQARRIAEINAEHDAKMACLNKPGAAQRAADFMSDSGRLNGRVKAGDY